MSRRPPPFYDTDAPRTSKETGKRVKKTKTKARLINELKDKVNFEVRKYLSLDDVEKIATKHKICTTYTEPEIDHGFLGQPKGLLQVLWERGWIDVDALSKYPEKGRKNQLDSNGKILPEYEPYVLLDLMKKCPIFMSEPSAMESLFVKISNSSTCKMSLLTSPKYHCEIVGEGIEYNWGLLKKHYRRTPLVDKQTKAKFNVCIVQTLK